MTDYIASGLISKMNEAQRNADVVTSGGLYGDTVLVTMEGNDMSRFLQAGYDPVTKDPTGIVSEDDITYYTRTEARDFVREFLGLPPVVEVQNHAPTVVASVD